MGRFARWTGSNDELEDDVSDLLPGELMDPENDPADEMDANTPDEAHEGGDTASSGGGAAADTEIVDEDAELVDADDLANEQDSEVDDDGVDADAASDATGGDDDEDDESEGEWLDDAPTTPIPGDPDDLTSVELSHWSTDARRMLAGLLVARGIIHAWQGGELTTQKADASHVDRLIADVEQASEPQLDVSAEKTVYEVAEWPIEAQSTLAQRLAESGIPHEWDMNGDLVALDADEDRLDAIFDEIELPDPDDEESEQPTKSDLPTANEVMTALFLAADRLRRNAHDADGVLGLLPAAEDALRIPLPFGFEAAVWKDLVSRVAELKECLEGDDAEDEEIRELAGGLHRQLAEYV